MATLKNTSVTGNLQLPAGTTAQRPTNPPDGSIRFNTTLGYAEMYYKGWWTDISTGSGIPIAQGANLQMWLDAAHPSSYPGSGSTWTDLTGKGNNMSLTGTNFVSEYGGAIQTTASTSSYGVTSTMNYSSTDYTLICASRYDGPSKGRIVNAGSNNWLIGHWSDTTENHYAEGWISPVDQGPTDENVRVYAATGKIATDHYSYWTNGRMRSEFNTGGSQGPNQIMIGKYGPGNSEVSNGRVYTIMVWNTVLPNDEIKRISYILMARYGIYFN